MARSYPSIVTKLMHRIGRIHKDILMSPNTHP